MKISFNDFGTMKVAHVAFGTTIFVQGRVYMKIVGRTKAKSETCSLVDLETGRVEEISQHFLCLEVELEVVVSKFKKKRK